MTQATVRGKNLRVFQIDEPVQMADGKWNVCYQEVSRVSTWRPFFTLRYDTPRDASLAAYDAVLTMLIELESEG